MLESTDLWKVFDLIIYIDEYIVMRSFTKK